MSESSATDPRWGDADRDAKGRAILGTLELHFGRSLRDGTWLDIGCGSGGIAAELAPNVECVLGVDPETWRRWRDFEALHSNLKFLVGKYVDLPHLDLRKEIDVVVCNQVYEHVDDPQKLLMAIESVLNEKGICYFAGPNLLWPIEPHVFWPFVHWLPRGFAQAVMRWFGSKRSQNLDAYSWSYWRLTRAFRAAGFSYRSVIRERLIAGQEGNLLILRRLVGRLPRAMYSALSPFAPGFVFVLFKTPNLDARS